MAISENNSPAVEYAMDRFRTKLAEVDRAELDNIASQCSSECVRWCRHKLAREVLSLRHERDQARSAYESTLANRERIAMDLGTANQAIEVQREEISRLCTEVAPCGHFGANFLLDNDTEQEICVVCREIAQLKAIRRNLEEQIRQALGGNA